MSRHERALNQTTRQAGVAWHACDGCGRDWPFPMGVPPEVNPELHELREWRCHCCVQAQWARVERAKRLREAVQCEALEALAFYANPATYFAVLFVPDVPAGEIMNDFSETELGAKPGRQARASLARLEEMAS